MTTNAETAREIHPTLGKHGLGRLSECVGGDCHGCKSITAALDAAEARGREDAADRIRKAFSGAHPDDECFAMEAMELAIRALAAPVEKP